MGYIISAVVYTKYQSAQIRWKRIHSQIGPRKDGYLTYFEMEYGEDLSEQEGFSEFWNFRDIFGKP